ncbi:hypothetical protein ACQP2H_05610 [Micromonospora sp. CA-248260]|uniref:hypothetical protein n=1 Tax=Micromonospora sp. CA-248260 TaxID=3239962 RepID=UPI003D901420
MNEPLERQLTAPFTEYREVSVTDPLRQGDIIEAVAAGASMWQRHLLVITADCDLAFAKHQGRVTCVPLLTTDEYLMEMQIPRLREKYSKKAIGLLCSLMPEGAPAVSETRLRAWCSEAEPNEIASSLGLSGRDAETVSAVLTSIRFLDSPAGSLKEAVDGLVEALLALPNAQKREKIVQQIVNALKAPYAQPPGDALFLSAIAPRHDLGYFVYLRQLEQVLEPEIAIGPTRIFARYRRISRLQDRYVHALAQRFALVFMSIGLPVEYEEIRDLHSELLGENFR